MAWTSVIPQLMTDPKSRLTGTGFNNNGATATVSLWKAADLAPLGSFTISPGSVPFGACSDGVNFWITQPSAGKLVRF
jgi:hypothetical protein